MQERTRAILFGRPKKKKSDDHPLSRRELISLMFKVAFLEAMALSIILPSVVSTGEITATGTCIAPNVAHGCQLWASGNFTMMMPIGSISNTITVSWPSPPQSPQPLVGLQNETDNQQDWQLPPIDFYLGQARSWTVPAGPTELWGTAENEKICEFIYLCLPSTLVSQQGACTFYANVVNGGTGGTHLRVQWSPDLITWHDFLSDIAQAGDIVISGTGLQFSQGGQNTVPINFTEIKNNISFNAPAAFRVIGFNSGGTITLGDIFMTCIIPNAQEFVLWYTLKSPTSMDITVTSLIPFPWLVPLSHLFPVRIAWRVWIS